MFSKAESVQHRPKVAQDQHGLGNCLDLIKIESPGLEVARHRQGIECCIPHTRTVAPPTCRFNPTAIRSQ